MATLESGIMQPILSGIALSMFVLGVEGLTNAAWTYLPMKGGRKTLKATVLSVSGVE